MRRIAIVVAVWIVATVAGMAVLIDYEVTPGADTAAPESWPARSALPRSTERPTLLVAAHPRCPCTKASIGELNVLLAKAPDKFDVHVVFVRPAGTGDAWVREGDVYRDAAELPGVQLHIDPAGRELKLFGAATSGAALLYDPSGTLLFRGGLTGSRGHQGDNAGRTALTALAWGREPDRRQTFVFGCSLWSSHS